MGFALWIDRDVVWAQGLHEYRPMGVAVISATDQFRSRDFHPARPAPPRSGRNYAGLFASLEELNRTLTRRRRRKPGKLPKTPAWI